MNAIELERVSFAYNANYVLDDISLIVGEKEYICVFGPNGGGKTTLLFLLMGFLKPTRGKIRIFGKDPKKSRTKIGWVPQNFSFDRDFPISVQEVVLGGRLAHIPWNGRFQEEDYRIVKEVLEELGLLSLLHAPYSALSGGQAQRVLIARALASQPSLLLLDEPTSSIDITAQQEVYKLLHSLKDRMTILMVTHDLNSAVEQVDRLLCVQKKLTSMSSKQVCEHFAIGLYHSTEDST